MKPVLPIGGWYLRVSSRMITCREFNDFIFDYTEGLLTDQQTKLFESHMRVCPMCRDFLKTYIAAYKAAKHSFADSALEVPSTVPQDLLNAIASVSDHQASSKP